MEKSLMQSMSTAISVLESNSSTKTFSDGSKTVTTKTITNLERSRTQGMADTSKIERMTQARLFLSRFQIQKEGSEQQRNELKDYILECLTPATYAECVYFVLRMLNHFPQRNTTKDAIIAADIAAELVLRKCSVVAVCEACKELWLKSSEDNRFPPASGTIVTMCADHTKKLNEFYEFLSIQKLPMLIAPKLDQTKQTWEKNGKWQDWDEGTRYEFFKFHKDWDRSIFKFVERIYGITYDELREADSIYAKSGIDIMA